MRRLAFLILTFAVPAAICIVDVRQVLEAACECRCFSLEDSDTCTIADANGDFDWTLVVNIATNDDCGTGITLNYATNGPGSSGVENISFTPSSGSETINGAGETVTVSVSGELTTTSGNHNVCVFTSDLGCSTNHDVDVGNATQSCPL